MSGGAVAPDAGPRTGRGGSGRQVLFVGIGLVAVALLARQAGGPGAAGRALLSADAPWLLATVVAASGSYVAAALVQHGAVGRTVGLPRLVVVQLACAFTNRLLPAGAGGMATNVRALSRAGIPVGRARLCIALGAVAGVAMHLVTLLAATPFLMTVAPLRRRLLSGQPVALAMPVVLLAVFVLALHPPGSLRRLVPRLGFDRQHLRQLADSPSDLALLAGGSLGITACHAAAFATALHAVGTVVPLPTVLAVYVVAVALAGLVPTPGGVGGVDAALLLMLAAVGVPTAAAAAGVLVFRLATFWLPILPGVGALLWALRRGWL